jgi:TolA-binding protein
MRPRWRLAPLLAAVALAGVALPAGWPSAAAPSAADRLWAVGTGAFEDGLYELAARELGRFAQAAPADARRGDGAYLRGRALFALGRYAEALAEFEAAESYPVTRAATGEPMFWQGESLFRLRRIEEARDRYARFLAMKPASPHVAEALYARGMADLELGHPDTAVGAFLEFLRDHATHERAPIVAYSAARELVRAKRFDEALPVLAPYASRYPRSPYLVEARYLLGVTQLELGRAEGVRTLEQFLAQSPTGELAVTARLLVAEAQTKAGRLREALEHYLALVRAAPTHALAPQALYQAGDLALRLGRVAEAEAAWGALRRDFPQHALAGPAGLATARLHERRKQWEQALETAQWVADLRGPERPDALLIVGQSALQLRRNPESAQAYHTAMAEAPPGSKRYFEGLAGLAAALEAATDREGAKRAYREIVDAAPDAELIRWARARLQALEPPPPPPARDAARARPRPKAPARQGGGS